MLHWLLAAAALLGWQVGSWALLPPFAARCVGVAAEVRAMHRDLNELSHYRPQKRGMREKWMEKTPLSPHYDSTGVDRINMGSIIRAASNGQTKSAMQMFEQLACNRTSPVSLKQCDVLLCKLGERGELPAAQSVFQRLPALGLRASAVTYSILISRAARWGHLDLARSYYEHMRASNISPDVPVINAFLAALAKAAQVDEGLSVLTRMVANGMLPTLITINTLLDACAHAADAQNARELFHNLTVVHGLRPDARTFASLAHALARAGDLQGALGVLHAHADTDVAPTLQIYSILIDAFGNAGNFAQAFALVQEMRGRGLAPTVVTLSALIAALGKDGQLSAALTLYRSLLPPQAPAVQANVITCTGLLHCCLQRREYDAAWEVLRDMQTHGIALTAATACVLAQGLAADRPRLLEALHILRLQPVMPGEQMTAEEAAGAAGAAGAAELGSRGTEPNSVFLVLDEIHRSGVALDLAAFNVLLDACAEVGDLPRAMATLQRMRVQGLQPDVISYTSLIKACLHASGNRVAALQQGEKVFRAMPQRSRTTFLCMLQLHFSVAPVDYVRVSELCVQMHSVGALDGDAVRLVTKKLPRAQLEALVSRLNGLGYVTVRDLMRS